MISAFGLPELPIGINSTLGMCGNDINNDNDYVPQYPAAAYSMNRNAMITIASADIFTDGFPIDFSILVTLRYTGPIESVPLFSMYSSTSERVFAFIVGSDVALQYQDMDGNPLDDEIISFGVSIADNR